jgi:hypothetical protein
LNERLTTSHGIPKDVWVVWALNALFPDLVEDGSALPGSRSKASKWTKTVRDRLPEWIDAQVLPVLQEALARDRLEVKLQIGGADHDKLLLRYPAHKLGTSRRPAGSCRSCPKERHATHWQPIAPACVPTASWSAMHCPSTP